MSLILVATVGGVLLVRLRRCPPDGRVGVRRGGARDTAGNGERAAHRRVRPTIVPDDPSWPRAAASVACMSTTVPAPWTRCCAGRSAKLEFRKPCDFGDSSASGYGPLSARSRGGT